MTADEMQNAVMSPTEPELFQQGISLAGEIPVGEEQQLDQGRQIAGREERGAVEGDGGGICHVCCLA